jgi:hypothetical protein
MRDNPARSKLAEKADIASEESLLWLAAAVGVIFLLAGASLATFRFIRSGRSTSAAGAESLDS